MFHRDIVDQEHADGNFFKMLLGAINPLFDDDDEEDRSSGGSHQSYLPNGSYYGGNGKQPVNGSFYDNGPISWPLKETHE